MAAPWSERVDLDPGAAADLTWGPRRRRMDRLGGAEGERDRGLIAATAGGDEQALAALYDRHAAALLGVALRILKSRQDAEDLVHDVFVEAWQRAGDFDERRGSVRGWLLVRARSRAVDRLRSLEAARRRGLLARADISEGEASVEPIWDGLDRARAKRALDSLPEAQRALVELAYFEGLSCSEMAERCGIPIGTVKSRLSAGMAKLRQELAPTSDARRAER
jgi:RNA polymerase sigma-70 factor (ECF subfamily)